MSLHLRILDGDYSVNRLPNTAPIPPWADGDGFVSISRTTDELSIVCLSIRAPTTLDASCRSDQGWTCLQLVGPFAFDLTGVLLAVLEPLAEAKVGIFAVSTFDTDYVMVKTTQLTETLEALAKTGHTID
jgi:uncharacterized protein